MTRLNLLLLLALVASAVYLVRVAYDARRLYAEIDRAQAQERQLDTEFEQQKAEKQAQATPSRVEKAAREKLGMRNATPAITEYVTNMRAAGAPEAAR